MSIKSKKALDQQLIVQSNLNAILTTTPDAIITIDTEGRIISSNPATTRIFGYQEEELAGRSILTLIPERYHDRHLNGMNRIAQTGVKKLIGKSTEVDGLCKSGKEIPIELSLSEWSVGGEIFFTAIIRDISTRKEADSIRNSIIENSPIGVYIAQHGIFVFTNEKFENQLGYQKDELSGRSSLDVVFPDDRALVKKAATAMVKGETTAPYEFRIITASGEVKWVMELVSSIIYRGERATLGKFMDISEQKEREKELLLFSTALKSIHECVITLDNDFIVTGWNNICEDVFGIKAIDAVGKYIGDVRTLAEDYPGQNDDRLNKLKARGYDWGEQVYQTPKGNIDVDVHIQAIHDDIRQYGWVILAIDITAKKRAAAERERLITELKNSLANVKTLSGLLPICAWCKNMRNEQGYWESVEEYISQHSMADFSHSICPDCAKKYFPEKTGALSDEII